VFPLLALLTSLLCPGPYGQTQTPVKASFVRARVLVRLSNREASALEAYFRELSAKVPRYGRFHPQIQNLERKPLGAGKREDFDLCLGLYESEILDLESRLASIDGKPWRVQGGEAYGLIRGGQVLPLPGRLPERVYLPDPLSEPRFTAVLATWRRAFGTEALEDLCRARPPELLPESRFVRETLRRFPEETGLLRLDADQVQTGRKQILLLLCAGLARASVEASRAGDDRARAKRELLRDLFDRLQKPDILARIYRRQGYLPPDRALAIDRYPPVGPIEVQEALDRWSRGPLPRVLDPRGKGAEVLTTILFLVFGTGILILLFRSFRRA